MSNESAADTHEGIAIIGMAGRFPGARDIEQLWANLKEGIDSISHFEESELEISRLDPPGSQLRPNYVRAHGVLEDADRFDAAFFGVTPREAAVMDPQQRLFLEISWAALENAGYDPAAYSGSIGVWAGQTNSTYYLENVLARRDILDQIGSFQAILDNGRDYLTTRVSYKLDLRGPSVNICTACSTSLVAVCHARQALLDYQCDMALSGGVSVCVPQARGYLYQDGGIGSPDGRCRPFDANAAGTVGGNGAGVVVLKRLEDALEDGDTIYAVIKGSAVNSDGSGKVSFTAPSVDGQAEAIALAQAVAGVDPETISYVETHGTATPLGDPIEVAALTQAFRAGTEAKGFCAIGSVKGNIGHLDAAAGVTSLIKTTLALHREAIPPSPHLERPNPAIDFESSPFFVNSQLRAWPRGPRPRRAGVSSFGIGGTNAHVVLEEAPVAAPESPARTEQLLLLSARSESALKEATANLAHHLRQEPEPNLADVAYTLQVGRKPFAFRRVVACRDAAEGATALEALDPKRVFGGRSPQSESTVAFLFPGQGAQHVGMAAGLYQSEAVFKTELDACAAALMPHLEIDIRSLIFAEPPHREEAERRLAETAITQPVLFAVEHALACLWMSWGVTPDAMIGHSLGEYVAACLAGVLSRDDAVGLVATRGRLMQAQPRGAMLAVRKVAAELDGALGSELAIAGLNSPEFTVVSGPEAAVRALESRLETDGVRCRPLATSHAFHSSMMDGAMAPFREAVSRVKLAPPRLPWVSCLTGDWITAEQALDPDYWVQQLREPVRFSKGVGTLAEDSNRALLEVGPGHALSTLVRQHRARPAGQAVVTSLGPEPENDVRSLLEALGRLWMVGVKPDWGAVHGGERRRRVPLPTYPFERKRFWIDPPPIGASEGSVESTQDGSPPPLPDEEVAAEPLLSPTGLAETRSPASILEGRLRGLLSGSSGIPPGEIDPAVSFLELGFDSLLLIQVSAALETHLGVTVTYRELVDEVINLHDLTAHVEAQLEGQQAQEASGTPSEKPASAPGAAADVPPVPGARLGRDAAGNPAWFVPDPDRPGKYLQVTIR